MRDTAVNTPRVPGGPSIYMSGIPGLCPPMAVFPHHPSAARLNPCHVSERVTHGYPLPGMCRTHMLSLILTNQSLHPPASELNLFSSFKMCGSEFYVKILMQSPIPSPLSPNLPECGSVFIHSTKMYGTLIRWQALS